VASAGLLRPPTDCAVSCCEVVSYHFQVVASRHLK